MYWAGALRTRVVSSSGWTVQEEYTYNAIGNLATKGGVSYSYPPSGPTSVRPHAVITTSAGFSAAYDANGNMTTRDGAMLTYDAENRLTSVTQDGRVTTFTYDADGRRVKKTTPWGTTYYIGEHYEKHIPAAGLSVLPGDVNLDCQVSVADIQEIAAQWGAAWSAQHDVDQDGSAIDAGDIQTAAANWPASVPSPCNQATTKYYRLGDRLIALRQNGQLRYVHTDHLGSLSLLTDESGRMVRGSEQRFLPFGAMRTGQPVVLPTSRNFTGQPLDFNTGLLYYEARYYDAALGRWAQPDTIVPNPGNPQDLNRYSYVRNNPLRYIDPTGHCIPGVDCPGTVSGLEHPPDPSNLRGEEYAAWLTQYILWLEQQKAETGGMLDIELGQQAAGVELNVFLMKDPEVLGDILFQEVAQAIPQIMAMVAGSSSEVLLSGAGRAVAIVRQAAKQRSGGTGLKMLPAPPPGSVNPWEGPIESIVLQQDTVMYRVWGGESGRVGQWLTPTRPRSSTSAQQLLALPDSNTAEYVSEVVVPAGTRIQVGRAAANFGRQGGALQVQLLVKPSELNPSWFGPGQRLP